MRQIAVCGKTGARPALASDGSEAAAAIRDFMRPTRPHMRNHVGEVVKNYAA